MKNVTAYIFKITHVHFFRIFNKQKHFKSDKIQFVKKHIIKEKYIEMNKEKPNIVLTKEKNYHNIRFLVFLQLFHF